MDAANAYLRNVYLPAFLLDMDAANAYLRNVYLPAFNAEFAQPSREDGSAFVPCPASVVLDDILGITTPDSVL